MQWPLSRSPENGSDSDYLIPPDRDGLDGMVRLSTGSSVALQLQFQFHLCVLAASVHRFSGPRLSKIHLFLKNIVEMPTNVVELKIPEENRFAVSWNRNRRDHLCLSLTKEHLSFTDHRMQFNVAILFNVLCVQGTMYFCVQKHLTFFCFVSSICASMFFTNAIASQTNILISAEKITSTILLAKNISKPKNKVWVRIFQASSRFLTDISFLSCSSVLKAKETNISPVFA